MEAGIVLIILFALVSGITIGVFNERSRHKKEGIQGTIYVYCGESGSNPSLLLEYGVPIEDIISRKRVTLDVNVVR